jgi:hypothetical protein
MIVRFSLAIVHWYLDAHRFDKSMQSCICAMGVGIIRYGERGLAVELNFAYHSGERRSSLYLHNMYNTPVRERVTNGRK